MTTHKENTILINYNTTLNAKAILKQILTLLLFINYRITTKHQNCCLNRKSNIFDISYNKTEAQDVSACHEKLTNIDKSTTGFNKTKHRKRLTVDYYKLLIKSFYNFKLTQYFQNN